MDVNVGTKTKWMIQPNTFNGQVFIPPEIDAPAHEELPVGDDED